VAAGYRSFTCYCFDCDDNQEYEEVAQVIGKFMLSMPPVQVLGAFSE
jgi:hypothetical protein